MRSSISYYFSLGFTSQAFCKILRVLLKLKVNCPRQRRAPGHSQSQAHTRQTENRGESNETFVSLVVHWPAAHQHKFGQNNAGKLPALWWVVIVTRWLGQGLWRVFGAMSDELCRLRCVTGGRGRDNCQSLSLLQGRPATGPGHVIQNTTNWIHQEIN